MTASEIAVRAELSVHNCSIGRRVSSVERVKGDRVPEVDVLRFMAALAVMCFHYFGWAHIPSPADFGWLGVQLFFMISGFVILWSVQGKTPKQFVLSRFARLYPSYWVCLTITAIALTYAGQQIGTWRLLANYTMFQVPLNQPHVDSVYWTLYVELKFYFMILALLLLRQQRYMEHWLMLWLAGAIASFFVPLLAKLTLGYYAAFFISGAMLFYIRSQGLTPRRAGVLIVSMALGIYSATLPEMLDNYQVPGRVLPVAASR